MPEGGGGIRVTVIILHELNDKKRARYGALGSQETIEDSVLLGHRRFEAA